MIEKIEKVEKVQLKNISKVKILIFASSFSISNMI